ncbi:hypothetical protein Daura_24250 [Dactylosporangium aurantiacum]|uniref:Uncharacterized protein n=1 Tax=Dactylosporangium aurantiacum TaxID=35754 RepID=A0A9Q9IT61_9ACTN|nr:hypothetical protein [Dactylosporangium aurantiacum]MDG6103794.1 hypothetical protein [Dactylosporangium aurantiacum]UWZ58999.1 hypothetical protein Daura_24250 [Dactylosporangium aurantiacum]
MNRTLLGITAVAVGGAGVVAGRRMLRRPATTGDDGRARWHSITVNCSPERLGAKPPPLDELGFPVEVRIRPAPGDHGTELAVRMTGPEPAGPAKALGKLRDDDPVRAIRRALREARSLAEVGEVLLPDAPPTTDRTLTGAPLAYATRHGREEGRL